MFIGYEGTYFTIPFLQRAEISLKSATNFSVSQGQKTVKYVPPSLSVKYVQMNPFGIPKQGAPIESRTYYSIVLANLPVAGERGVPPNPTKPWLELSLVEIDVSGANLLPSN